MSGLQVLRSSDLCRTTSPKMIPKKNKRRKSSKVTTPDIEQPPKPTFELGLCFVNPTNNNNNNNNSDTENQEKPTRRISRHKKISEPCKKESLVATGN